MYVAESGGRFVSGDNKMKGAAEKLPTSCRPGWSEISSGRTAFCIASTLDRATAALTVIDAIRAWACGERSVTARVAISTRRSSEKLPGAAHRSIVRLSHTRSPAGEFKLHEPAVIRPPDGDGRRLDRDRAGAPR
jgi:hypothetical protein